MVKNRKEIAGKGIPASRVAALIAQALDAKDPERWEIVCELHRAGSRSVLDHAVGLCGGRTTNERCLGADLLGQLGVPKRVFADECVSTLLAMLRTEKSPSVLNSVAVALGHQGDGRAVLPLARLKTHKSKRVRQGVAFGLLGHEHPAAIRSLLFLMDDQDAGVRNWATFGIARQVDADSKHIRAHLWRRLCDRNAEVRGEALMGLAIRRDPRVASCICRELNQKTVSPYTLNAAAELGDPCLFESLKRSDARGNVTTGIWMELKVALRACQPQRESVRGAGSE
ncbi:MAG: HEAT repeat domain-containing protein [Candidatus Hydrogenedentes bacterium]|nr:HEAT repeat domain-containing protein [Candidatus Hydrogenedentota bacterium]